MSGLASGTPDDPNWAETKNCLKAHRVNKIDRVKRNLHKQPEGSAIMQYLASGKFDAAKNLAGLLLNLKQKDMLPEALASLVEADRLLGMGCAALYFEDKTYGDVDVGALTSAGELVAIQVKATSMKRTVNGLKNSLNKGLRQLTSVPASRKIVAIHFRDGTKSLFDTKFRAMVHGLYLLPGMQIRIVYPDGSEEYI